MSYVFVKEIESMPLMLLIFSVFMAKTQLVKWKKSVIH